MGLSAAHNQEAEREAVRVDHVRDLFQDMTLVVMFLAFVQAVNDN